ncbi:hypothetical protein [uncultured Tateyamaria sp.]|uniref:hypothetical protein n=1 Tax=uncultured Tateyamaria sp. TaxID=455651 RepID=UPI002636D4B2|nr:hypothetical protein [uncultured Tateyamaria sp.]
MLTVTMRQILEQSAERTFVAQVIRVPSNAATEAHIYHLGITLEDGRPRGLVTAATGDVLRRWKRFSSVERFLAKVHERLICITMYPTTCPLPTVVDMLVNQYRLDYELKTAPLESERKRLIAAFRSGPLEDSGMTPNKDANG